MKKIVSFIIMSMIFFSIHAQVMQAKPIWSTISIPQLKCWECRDRLDKFLTTEVGPNNDAGIIKWTFYLTSATMRIQYYPDRITLAFIQTEIANAGFDADTVRAEPTGYSTLPPICKRKEDGGGQKKGAPPCTLPPDERASIDVPKL